MPLVKKNIVLIWSDLFPELGLVAEALSRGMRWLSRVLRVRYGPTYDMSLARHLERLFPPKRVLFIAHGEGGRFLSGENPREEIPGEWWAGSDHQVEVYALGCGSAACFDEYGLNERVKSYLGYKEDVSFFVGTRRARKIFSKLLGGIGRSFVTAERIDERFLEEVQLIYIEVMNSVAESYQQNAGDRLNLIFFEEQLQGLQLLGGK